MKRTHHDSLPALRTELVYGQWQSGGQFWDVLLVDSWRACNSTQFSCFNDLFGCYGSTVVFCLFGLFMFVYIQPSVWFGIPFPVLTSWSHVQFHSDCPTVNSAQWKWMWYFVLLFQINSEVIMMPGWLAELVMVPNWRRPSQVVFTCWSDSSQLRKEDNFLVFII